MYMADMQAWTPPEYATSHPPSDDSLLFENWRPPPGFGLGLPAVLDFGSDIKGDFYSGRPPPAGIEVSDLVYDMIREFPKVQGDEFFIHRPPVQPCTRACGGGWALQLSVCVSIAMHTTAPLEVCMADLGEADTRLLNCSSAPCDMLEAHWELGDWTRSALHCDGGLQDRSMRCIRNGQDAETSLCGDLTHPQARPVFSTPCMSFGWYLSPWTPCSSQCGWGLRVRRQACVDQHNATVPWIFCPQIRMPLLSKCYSSACPDEADTAESQNLTVISSHQPMVEGQEPIRC
jgi:hypothetical protein